MSEEFDIFDNINNLRNAGHLVLPIIQTPKSGKCLNKSFDFDSPSGLDVWLNETLVKQTSKKRNHTNNNDCRKIKQKEKKQNESKQQSNENKQNKSNTEENCEIQKSKSTNKRKTRKQKEKPSESTERRLSPRNPTVESQVILDNINDGTLLERFIARRSQNRRSKNLHTTQGSSVQQIPIACIDLSSSPIIPFTVPDEQTIDLLSDDENDNNNGNYHINQINKSLLDQSIGEENPVVNVNIVWKGQMETFKLRKYQKFRNIFQIIADRENIKINNLLFNIDNVIVGPDDTPESLNYNSLDYIGGRILDDSIISDMDKIANVKTNREDIIKLKIQSNKFKRPFYVDLQKTQHLRILYIKCSEELNLPVDKLTLSFDGDLIKHEDKPVDFEFEGGEVIDLHIKP